MRELTKHGTLIQAVRDEAIRWGWKAMSENLDIDPCEPTIFGPRPCPGRGDVNLSPPYDGDVVTFEYQLPEDYDSIIGTVRNIIRDDLKARNRLEDPDEFNRPIVIGG